jgi:type VI secretion system protein ImpH
MASAAGAREPDLTPEPASATESESPATARARFIELVARAPYRFDFYQVLRRLECLSQDLPRLGTAARPADEPIRLGQEPSLAFAPTTLATLKSSAGGGLPWLRVNFFGLLGPNGPMPLHLTEYAAERARHVGDGTLGRFFDLFHHRLLLIFYRSWANSQPTADMDRPSSSRFLTFVGALCGLGLPSLRGRDALPDAAKLFYAGRLSARTHNAEGLAAMVGDYFRMPARVQSFVGGWMDLPPEQRWHLGRGERRLGRSSLMGAKAFSRSHKFRVVLGPLDRNQFQRMLPGRPSLATLSAMVRSYAGDALEWDLKLMLDDRTEEPLTLNRSRLGWTSWLGVVGPGRGGERQDLILNPALENNTHPPERRPS